MSWVLFCHHPGFRTETMLKILLLFEETFPDLTTSLPTSGLGSLLFQYLEFYKALETTSKQHTMEGRMRT